MDPDSLSAEQRRWEQTCPASITSDAIWKLDAYRAALFLLHLSRSDCRAIRAQRTDDRITQQLSRAVASISANIGEGYSRSSRADRLRFFDYALGSTRECSSWYQATRDSLSDEVVDDRLSLLSRLRALLLGFIRSTRQRSTPRFDL